MEDCDDGIGSEINTPRHTEGLHQNPARVEFFFDFLTFKVY